MKNLVLLSIALTGFLLVTGCTIQETAFNYTTAQTQVLERLQGNVYRAEDPDDQAQTATLALGTLYVPPRWFFVSDRGYNVYGTMEFSKFTSGVINDGYPLQLFFNLSKDGEHMTMALSPDFEMLGEMFLYFPTQTTLRLVVPEGEMTFILVE
ncbi:MAG TPA: hypothetical protein PLM86_07010 [Bacteroidales bacterium]|nr:hypothetical protein [Bacteroidales bacterium]OQB68731.1 MAG: hypothetical protein BWX93_01428 [Bacteroidetes bacterium ADurb.Bin139]MDD4436359.1 hypothetical protein [Bacteroidales bacterium]HOG25919.1 hypothetical protein [Bacteroidales bacterium]HOR12028.1 hypothetical protein [Bacteroidales bacterium]